MQLDVVLLHQLVLNAVDFGHNGDGRPGVLGPREGNAGEHLLFTLQEEITYIRSQGATGFVEVSLEDVSPSLQEASSVLNPLRAEPESIALVDH